MKSNTLKKIIEEYTEKNLLTYSEDYSLFLAFISCFSAKEVIENLDWENSNQQILKGFKNKIQYDLKNNIEIEVYTNYFLELLRSIEKFSTIKKRKIIAFISQNFAFFNQELLKIFIDYCLKSKNKTFRNSAWKNISPNSLTKEKLLEFYYKHKDEKALPVIYQILDRSSFLEFINNNFEGIRSSEYFFRKICLDMFLILSDEIKEKIKSSEPETYLYLHIKNNLSVPEEEVFSLYKKSSNKSFAIWCIGKMKYIGVLNKLKNNLHI